MAKNATTSNFKSFRQPGQLNAMEFRAFAESISAEMIKRYGAVAPSSVYTVAVTLSLHCTFDTGRGIRLSEEAISGLTKLSRGAVSRALAVLKAMGVIEVVDMQRRAGSPSANYELRRSTTFRDVMGADFIILTTAEKVGVAKDDEENRAAREKIVALSVNRPYKMTKIARENLEKSVNAAKEHYIKRATAHTVAETAETVSSEEGKSYEREKADARGNYDSSRYGIGTDSAGADARHARLGSDDGRGSREPIRDAFLSRSNATREVLVGDDSSHGTVNAKAPLEGLDPLTSFDALVVTEEALSALNEDEFAEVVVTTEHTIPDDFSETPDPPEFLETAFEEEADLFLEEVSPKGGKSLVNSVSIVTRDENSSHSQEGGGQMSPDEGTKFFAEITGMLDAPSGTRGSGKLINEEVSLSRRDSFAYAQTPEGWDA